jgi:hypothetical protein
MFALAFVGASFPIPSASFQQVGPARWTLDVCSVVQTGYDALREAVLLLASPQALPAPGAPGGPAAPLALGLYVRCGDSPATDPWLYRGCVHAGRPTEVVSLQWPSRPDTAGERFAPAPGTALLGVAVEPLAELEARESTRLGAQLQLARAVAMDLSSYLTSFAKTIGGGGGGGGGGSEEVIALPPGAVDAWLARWEAKYRRDPDFVLRRARELIPPALLEAPPPPPRGGSTGGGGWGGGVG